MYAIDIPFVYMLALYEHNMAYLSCLRPNLFDSYICKGRVIVNFMLPPPHMQSSELMWHTWDTSSLRVATSCLHSSYIRRTLWASTIYVHMCLVFTTTHLHSPHFIMQKWVFFLCCLQLYVCITICWCPTSIFCHSSRSRSWLCAHWK